VTVEMDVHLPRLRIDASLLENALLNLAINARDAMPDGGALRISASLLRDAERRAVKEVELSEGDYVRISVTDTGSGMTPDVSRRALEPFFTTKPLGSGTGLGLSMVYAFVKQSGGNVQIESSPGRGCSIHLYLPANANDDEQVVKAAALAPADVRGHGEVVLVVEDDPSVRKLCLRTLALLNYQTVHASNGPEAIALLEVTKRVDVLLTDMVMPNGMSGKELANTVHARWPAVKVICMSGYTANVMDGQSPDLPMLLGKPFTIVELGSALQEALASQR
jgi:CheY-like chemotaxis protein